VELQERWLILWSGGLWFPKLVSLLGLFSVLSMVKLDHPPFTYSFRLRVHVAIVWGSEVLFRVLISIGDFSFFSVFFWNITMLSLFPGISPHSCWSWSQLGRALSVSLRFAYSFTCAACSLWLP